MSSPGRGWRKDLVTDVRQDLASLCMLGEWVLTGGALGPHTSLLGPSSLLLMVPPASPPCPPEAQAPQPCRASMSRETSGRCSRGKRQGQAIREPSTHLLLGSPGSKHTDTLTHRYGSLEKSQAFYCKLAKGCYVLATALHPILVPILVLTRKFWPTRMRTLNNRGGSVPFTHHLFLPPGPGTPSHRNWHRDPRPLQGQHHPTPLKGVLQLLTLWSTRRDQAQRLKPMLVTLSLDGGSGGGAQENAAEAGTSPGPPRAHSGA